MSRIDAIKVWRLATGWSLADSKDAVDKAERAGQLAFSVYHPEPRRITLADLEDFAEAHRLSRRRSTALQLAQRRYDRAEEVKRSITTRLLS